MFSKPSLNASCNPRQVSCKSSEDKIGTHIVVPQLFTAWRLLIMSLQLKTSSQFGVFYLNVHFKVLRRHMKMRMV